MYLNVRFNNDHILLLLLVLNCRWVVWNYLAIKRSQRKHDRKNQYIAIIIFIIIIYSCCYYYYLNHRASIFIIFRKEKKALLLLRLAWKHIRSNAVRFFYIRFNELLVAIPSATVSDFVLCLRSRLSPIHLNRQCSSRVLRCTFIVIFSNGSRSSSFIFNLLYYWREYYSFGFDLFAFHRPSMNRLCVVLWAVSLSIGSCPEKNIKLPFLKFYFVNCVAHAAHYGSALWPRHDQ